MDTIPRLTAEDAARSAQHFLLHELGITDATLSAPNLEIFNLGIFTGTRTPTHLAWFIEATHAELPLDESIWVDALTGEIRAHFSQVAPALTREIYNAVDNVLVRSEGQPPIGDSQSDLAYDYVGDAYNYFRNHHARDSYDDRGGAIRVSVHSIDSLCASGAGAYASGGSITYCNHSLVADDSIGHEFTHLILGSVGVKYAGEGVPISEGYATIFGETIDLTNGRGNDSPEMRWKAGEDTNAQGIPVWDIMNPTDDRWLAKGILPGKVSDPQTGCGDREAEYNNLSIPAHAYALMADGGSYNGYTIAGIGLAKAAKIHYYNMTNALQKAPSFRGHYDSLQAACQHLIGELGITAADCVEVKKALDAVEMTHLLCPEFLLTANTQHTIDVRLSRGDGTFLPPVAVGQNLGVNYIAFAILDNFTFMAATDENPPMLYSFRRTHRTAFTPTLLKTLDADPNLVPDYGLGLTAGVHRPRVGPLRGGTVPILLENINVAFPLSDGSTGYWIARGNLCTFGCNLTQNQYRDAFDFSSIFTGWTLGKSSNLTLPMLNFSEPSWTSPAYAT